MKDNSKPKAKGPIIVTMGLALFATQFGAGNLIFPPFLGQQTGSNWLVGFLGFFIMDVGLAALAIYSVVANREGTVDGVTNKIGTIPGKVFYFYSDRSSVFQEHPLRLMRWVSKDCYQAFRYGHSALCSLQ